MTSASRLDSIRLNLDTNLIISLAELAMSKIREHEILSCTRYKFHEHKAEWKVEKIRG